jgi:hypothetical protein
LEQHIPSLLHLLTIPSNRYTINEQSQGGMLRSEFEQALAAILIGMSRQKPLLLIFEDWH